MKVIFGTPDWHLAGPSSQNGLLIQALRNLGWDASVLLTNPPGPHNLNPPAALPQRRLDLPPNAPWELRWQRLKEHLEAAAPCIYVPGYDFLNFPIIPTLDSRVRVVGLALSDEAIYYRKLESIAPWLNGVIAVSTHIGEKLRRISALRGRVQVIYPGVKVSPALPERPATGPLRLVYTGRLMQVQKRIFDLPRLMQHLISAGVDAHLDIVGNGDDRPELEHQIRSAGLTSRITVHGSVSPEHISRYYAQAHVFVLVSDYEGLSVSLLEAMGAGCVPVITRTRSGATEAITDGVNGLLSPIGNPAAQAQAIASLAKDRQRLQRLSHAAWETASRRFSFERLVAGHDAFFRHVREEPARQRPPGKLVPPPELGASHQLVSRIRNRLKRTWRKLKGLAPC